MFKFDKWWFPDGETHMPEWMSKVGQSRNGRLSYQGGKYQESLTHVKRKKVAIDIGAHIGLWSYNMSHDFDRVICFEPLPSHIDCWKMNMFGCENAELYEVALGDKKGSISLSEMTNGSSGDTHITGDGNIPMITLDSLHVMWVDFIKIDCEGYELNVLKGAQNLLKRCKPVIVVEQKGDMAEKYGLEKLGAVNYLEKLGYSVKSEIAGDYILSWD